MSPWYAVPAIAAVVLATVLVGGIGVRRARSLGDFYVASRRVSPRWNAAAVSGEYLSAASYLGIAGLILAFGVDMLWYPVGYTAGYLVLLVVVAAPMRRSGAYTVPDFAELRLGSPTVRLLSSVLVVVIGWFYLLPQLQGAGLTVTAQTGAPPWVGGLVVCVVVVAAVMLGGMRSITFAQAFQFWLKLTALLIPAVLLLIAWRHDDVPTRHGYPAAAERTVVTVDAATTARIPVTQSYTVSGVVDSTPVRGRLELPAGDHRLGAGTRITLERGDVVPVVTSLPSASNHVWSLPYAGSREHPLYADLSLVLGICLGTMGLPHVVVRFYTNPRGRDARRTALVVVGLLSVFYLLPTVFGALGRLYTPDLLLTGQTDSTTLLLPERVLPGVAGQLVGAVITAGAFAAFLSTTSGLTVSVAGVLSQDVLRRLRSPVAAFRAAAVAAVVVPYLLSLTGPNEGVAALVGLAFAVAAATLCPLLVLGVWWRRLTDAGAVAGLIVGGVLATTAVVLTLVTRQHGWAAALLAQPAAWTVPAAFIAMIAVSMLTPRRVPVDVARTMVRLHAPESLDLPRSAARDSG